MKTRRVLADNLRYLRKEIKNISQIKVAKDIGITRSTWADYENKNSQPNADLLIKIANYFETSLDDLLKSDLRNKNVTRNVRLIPIQENNVTKQNIDFIPVKAKAGYTQGFSDEEYIKELFRFSLPKLPDDNYRAFEIEGDSMLPIQEGFVVVGKYLEGFGRIKNGKRYIFVLKDEGVVFKKVVNEVTKNKSLLLVSDNSNYLPYSINIEEVLEAWEMVVYICFSSKKFINR